MSRSFRRRIYSAPCGGGNRYARSLANRCMRRANAVKLKKALETGSDFIDIKLREASDTWDFPSDGLASYSYDGPANYAEEIWSKIRSVVNCTGMNPDISADRRFFSFYLSGYYDVEELCEFLEKPYTVKTLLAISHDDVRRFSKHDLARRFGTNWRR